MILHLKQTMLKKLNRGLAFLLVMTSAFYANDLKAQVPGGSCALAVAIGGTGSIPNCSGAVSFSDFTTDGAVPSCISGTYRRDGWYSFINPVAQNVTISATSNTASSNLIIQIFSVCGGAELGCVNNFPANGAQTEGNSWSLAAGTFYVKITNYSTSTPANMTANVCIYPTPSNNDCATPTALTPGAPSAACSPIAGTTGGATPQAAIPASCTGANTNNDDVWYSFVATATTHIITVAPTGTMDPVIQVYSTNPCAGAGTSIYCANASGAGLPEVASLTGLLTIGSTYWVRVYDVGTGVPLSPTFNICIQTPPANDNCTGAITLTPAATCINTAGNVNVATFSGIAGCGTSNPDDDVWYVFTATGTSHTITLTPSANFDPGFEVFTGTCGGGLTSILCNATGGSPGVPISSSFATTLGTVYYVRVFDYGTGMPLSTTFNICILNPPPANDDCAGAIALTPLTLLCVAGANQQTGDVSGATQTLPGCTGNANDDVWYSFTTTATASQPYLVTATGNGAFDPVIQVFSGTCATLVAVAGSCINATGPGGTESVTLTTGVQLAASTTYYVRVYDAGASYPTNTTFSVCVTIPPVNDNCGGPTLLVYGTQATPAACGGVTNGSLLGTTPSGFAANCGGIPNDDVWYNFVATSTTNIVTVVPCASMNVVVQAYSTSCGGTSIGCANAQGVGGTEVLTLSGLTIGLTYWVRVYDFTGSSACNTFTICVSTPPVNDPCSGAITLTPSSSCILTSGTLVNGSQSYPANCGGAVTSDVWYTFTATSANQTITVNGSAGLNVVYELFSTTPCGGAGTSLGCINNSGVGGNETFAWTTLTSGTQYWVRVYDFSGAPTTFAFAICVVSPIANDCINAYNICTNFTFSITPWGIGNTNDIPTYGSTGNPTGCLAGGELNATWWLINISASGTLEFTMGVGTQTGFTDWIMYPYTSGTCALLPGGTIAPVRCNWNAQASGGTGMVTTIPSGGNAGNYVAPLAVTAGQQYVVCFTNWSGLTTTVPLVFGGTASVTCAPLPIDMLYFTGDKQPDGNNLIKWATATETDNDYFILKRSSDASYWVTVATVQGAGNSTSQIEYQFVDKNPPAAVNYYRLHQVDYNGQTTPFSIIAINNTEGAPVVVKITNTLGQIVSPEYDGLRLIYYSDGKEAVPFGYLRSQEITRRNYK